MTEDQFWAVASGIRLRPVPEQSVCLAYRRHPPALFGLNLTSWLALTLCDGRDDTALTRAYDEAVRRRGGEGDALGALDFALRSLADLGLIERRKALQA